MTSARPAGAGYEIQNLTKAVEEGGAELQSIIVVKGAQSNAGGRMSEWSSIVDTLENIRDALDARDQENSLAGTTVLVAQLGTLVGHDARIWQATFPVLLQLKTCVESADFEAAHTITLAFLAKFRPIAARSQE